MSIYGVYFNLSGMDPTGLDCTITKDSIKLSLFNKNELDQINGKSPSLDGLANFLTKVRSRIPLPDLDIQFDFSWQTKACLQDCGCDRKAMLFEEDYKFQVKLAMNGSRIPIPQVPGTWVQFSGDFHLDQTIKHIHGGCSNVSRKTNCTQAGGKIEFSYCGGVPSVLQGCIKANIECNLGGCYQVGEPGKNTSGCKWKISAEGCFGPLCRSTEIFSGTFF
jgi:hypothetical protein